MKTTPWPVPARNHLWALSGLLSVGLVLLVACSPVTPPPVTNASEKEAVPPGTPLKEATFAGGCFWCMEVPFESVPGVAAVISGYTAGHVKNPTYEAVCAGTTGHSEAVLVKYDPTRVTYEDLLKVFWRQIDPTDAGGQFVDRGTQYRTEIYYHDEAQKKAAEKSKKELAASGRFSEPIVTPITAAEKFYPAEEYHQDYYKKKTAHYKTYRAGSGRDRYLDRVWGKDRTVDLTLPKATSRPTSRPSDKAGANKAPKFMKPTDSELRKRLTSIQYEVTQKDGTERPFKNEFWDNKKHGVYVDIVSGEPLFSSKDKFKSGTGWPSFTRPLVPENIQERTDHKIGYARTEVRSTNADSHLGHVFADGPRPTGLRYCINSAALRFVPKEKLEEEGLSKYWKD